MSNYYLQSMERRVSSKTRSNQSTSGSVILKSRSCLVNVLVISVVYNFSLNIFIHTFLYLFLVSLFYS